MKFWLSMTLIFKIFRKIYRKFKYLILHHQRKRRNKDFYNHQFLKALKETNELSNKIKSVLSNSFFMTTQNIPGAQKEALILNANNICGHKFKLLGSGLKNVSYKTNKMDLLNNCKDAKFLKKEIDSFINKIGIRLPGSLHQKGYKYEPIDWQLDFKSGYRWDNKKWYKHVQYGHKKDVDIKIPWELSRANHFLTLGQAYLITKNEKYTTEFVFQVADWIISNPYQYGANWACTMDVAIRACNWIAGLSFFHNSPLINDRFIFEITKSLYFHGLHIKNNLEKEYFSVKGNHYLSNITGLLYLGILFKDLDFGKKWVSFSITELKKEIDKQVYNDGCNFEASAYYHRLALELLFYPTVLAIKNSSYFKKDNWIESGNKIFGENYIEKLKKMFIFILNSIKYDGKLWQIGDNDNGRVHFFSSQNIQEVCYLLNFAAVFFKDKNFKLNNFDYAYETDFILGKKANSLWKNLSLNSIDKLESKSYKDAGWFILRKNKNFMFISAGQNGQNGFGGHSHNDKLSFTLSIAEEEIFVDSGTFTYTSDLKERNKFRSVYAHNTAVIDFKEQNRFKKNNLFFLYNDTKVKINKWEANTQYDLLDAIHYGYQRLSQPVLHRRQIIFDKKNNLWLIKDHLIGKGSHNIEFLFHLAPQIDHRINPDNFSVEIYLKNKKSVILKLINQNKKNINLYDEDGFVSEGYGQKIKNKNLVFSVNGLIPLDFIFLISESASTKQETLDNLLNLLNYQ